MLFVTVARGSLRWFGLSFSKQYLFDIIASCTLSSPNEGGVSERNVECNSLGMVNDFRSSKASRVWLLWFHVCVKSRTASIWYSGRM